MQRRTLVAWRSRQTLNEIVLSFRREEQEKKECFFPFPSSIHSQTISDGRRKTNYKIGCCVVSDHSLWLLICARMRMSVREYFAHFYFVRFSTFIMHNIFSFFILALLVVHWAAVLFSRALSPSHSVSTLVSTSVFYYSSSSSSVCTHENELKFSLFYINFISSFYFLYYFSLKRIERIKLRKVCLFVSKHLKRNSLGSFTKR